MQLQAKIFWQWARYLCRNADPSGKTPLLLNLDETAIPVVFTQQAGTVMVGKGAGVWKSLPRQRVSKADTRLYFTHVAVICNIPSIQPLLPQVIFLGAASITKAQFDALKTDLPDNVFLKRMPKGWNNSDQHREIVKLLSVILSKLPQFQPILCFDAAPLHLSADVLQELLSGSVNFLLVPAKMTYLLQPLDTHVFMRFKLYLKQRFVEAVLAGAPDENKTVRMVRLVIRAVRHVLQAHEWEVAFKQTGIWRDQSMVSSSILRNLCYEELPAIDSSRPAPELLRTLWPRNRHFHEELVMSLLPNSVSDSGRLPTAAASSSCSSSAPARSMLPYTGDATARRRLRSKTSVS